MTKVWAGPFLRAYKKGIMAGAAGLSRELCPYDDRRDSYKNSVTFSRAFRNAWFAGWDAAAQDKVVS